VADLDDPLRDELAAIAGRVQYGADLPPAATLRARGDRRQRRRMAGATAGLAVLAFAGGVAFVAVGGARSTVGGDPPATDQPAGPTAKSRVAAPSAARSGAPGVAAIPAGDRQVRIVVDGLNDAVLAVDPSGGYRINPTTASVADDLATWLLRNESGKYHIVLADPAQADQLCMTVVHDSSLGKVMATPCANVEAQRFQIQNVDNDHYSIFNGKRYVQVVDGPDALVPDLAEGLVTTYQFEDRGTPNPRIS
jgi:hypothetical protein